VCVCVYVKLVSCTRELFTHTRKKRTYKKLHVFVTHYKKVSSVIHKKKTNAEIKFIDFKIFTFLHVCRLYLRVALKHLVEVFEILFTIIYMFSLESKFYLQNTQFCSKETQ